MAKVISEIWNTTAVVDGALRIEVDDQGSDHNSAIANFKINGVSVHWFDKNGTQTSVGQITANAGFVTQAPGYVAWSGRANLTSPSDGAININNAAQTEQITIFSHAFTVATLPASAPRGSRAYVTDAKTPTFLGAAVGGGAVTAPVFFNGVGWVVG